MYTTRSHLLLLLVLLIATTDSDAESLPWPLPDAAALEAFQCPDPQQRLVATHYFYWYDWPGMHFFNDAQHTSTALRQHPPQPTSVSYRSKDWHRKQFTDMRAAGIDIALCVYWGAPDHYDRADWRFSIDGLPPMVAALDEMAAAGDAPKLGLFYDTSSLSAAYLGTQQEKQNIDLRTEHGRDIFYRTIRDFYCQIPPRHWACFDGRPIVGLYAASFAGGHDQRLLDEVYARFAADFGGKRPFIIAGPSWSQLKPDARVGWGATLSGPILGGDVVQIGAGYDDSPVPGRTTPRRDRMGGAYYSAGWLRAIRAQPRLVIIETWSEWHEGTAISDTLEDGRKYIDLTRQFSDRYRSGEPTTTDEWVDVVDRLLRASHSKATGREFADNPVLEFAVDAQGHLVQHGLTLDTGEADGRFGIAHSSGKDCLQSRPGVSQVRYIYFDVADGYYFDHSGTVWLEVTYQTAGEGDIFIEYDRAEAEVTADSRYRRCPQSLPRSAAEGWQTKKLRIDQARFGNGQNGGSDFRLVSEVGEMSIARLRLTKLPPEYLHAAGIDNGF